MIVSFKEPVTREQIMAMKGTLLHVPRSALPEPDEDEFYYTDLIGLTAEHLDGAPAGRVKAVHDFGAGEILELTTPKARSSSPSPARPCRWWRSPNHASSSTRPKRLMPAMRAWRGSGTPALRLRLGGWSRTLAFHGQQGGTPCGQHS